MSTIQERIRHEQAESARRQEAKKMEESKKNFDGNIMLLAERALEAQQERGAEDSITELLVNFLEVALEMKETMSTLTAINGAMQCITDAISFLDSAVDMDQAMMDVTLQHKYGLFSRIRQKVRTMRAISNHRRRMKQIIANLSAKMQMAESMVAIMKKFSQNMQKTNARKKKKAAAAGGAAAPSRAAAFLADLAKTKGVDTSAAPAAAAPATDSAPDTSGGVGMVGGVDIFADGN